MSGNLIDRLRERSEFLTIKYGVGGDAGLMRDAAEELESSIRTAEVLAAAHLEESAETKAAEAALSRIRAAMKAYALTWAGLDTDDGLAASVDTFIETRAAAEKAERWYVAAMTRLRDALGEKDEFPYAYNDAGIDRLVAEIERLRASGAA